MPQDEENKKNNTRFIYGIIVFLLAILTVSFVPSFGISIENSQIIIILIIVVLLLFRYFDVIEIPGFLKVSKELKELKNETKEIKQAQMNIMQTIAITQSANVTSSIQIINAATEGAKQEAEELLSDLPAFTITPNTDKEIALATAKIIMGYVQRRNYSAAFFDLRRTTTSLLRDITGIKDKKIKFYELLRTATKKELISHSLVESAKSVRRFSNLMIHMTPDEERRINPEEVKEIVDLGLRVLNELNKKKIDQTIN